MILERVFCNFSDPEYVPEILKLIDTLQSVGTHMNLTLDRPRGEIIPIIAKLPRGQSFRRWGKNMNISPWKQRGLHNFLPLRRGEPLTPQLAARLFELKQIYGSHIKGNG